MAIDVWGHIGSHNGRESTSLLLEALRDRCNVELVCIGNLSAASAGPKAQDMHEPDANAACLHARHHLPFTRPLYWVRLGQVDSNVHAFAGAFELEPFVGALFAPALNEFAATDARLDDYLAVLARAGRPAMFVCDPSDNARPGSVYQSARRQPKTTIIMTNLQDRHMWLEALDCLEHARKRTDARLFLCTAGVPPEDLQEAAAKLGESHFVFGSGLPLAETPEEDALSQIAEQLTAHRAALSEKFFAAWSAGTARKVFEL